MHLAVVTCILLAQRRVQLVYAGGIGMQLSGRLEGLSCSGLWCGCWIELAALRHVVRVRTHLQPRPLRVLRGTSSMDHSRIRFAGAAD